MNKYVIKGSIMTKNPSLDGSMALKSITEWGMIGGDISDQEDLFEELDKKVDKEENKSLMSNEEHEKLDSLHNYDDSFLRTEINKKQNIINDLDAIRLGAQKGSSAIQTESDPTVPSWAKQPTKPSYTASEVGALPTTTRIPSRVSELSNDSGYVTPSYHDATKQNVINDLDTIRAGASKGNTSLQTESDPVYLADKPNIALKNDIPDKTSDLTNDSGFITADDIDLSSYVKKTDYPSDSSAGVIKLSAVYGVSKNNNGYLQASTRTEALYNDAANNLIIGKGTLENIKESVVTSVGDGKYVGLSNEQSVTGQKTFKKGVVIETNETAGLDIVSASAGGYLYVTRGRDTNKVQMAIKSGLSGGTFGTTTNHQFQFRTSDVARMTINTDGSVVLNSDVSSDSNDNQVATTKWTNSKLDGYQPTLVSGTNIKTINNKSILGEGNINIQGGGGSAGNGGVYIITEDMVTVTTDSTKGVSPYSSTYGYTNFEIDKDIAEEREFEWKVGSLYTFVIDTKMVVSSSYRNVRIRIGGEDDGDVWHPLCNYTATILNGATNFVTANTVIYTYKDTMYDYGALHTHKDTDTTYSYLVNTIYGSTDGSPFTIDDKGYSARYTINFLTTPVGQKERWSSLVASSSTGSTKKIVSVPKFYIDRPPMVNYSANIAAGKSAVNSWYQDYAGVNIAYTYNTGSAWCTPSSRLYLWLKNFNPKEMTFEADATVGNIMSADKIGTRFPATTEEDEIYLYFLGWNQATWTTLNPNFKDKNTIYKYKPKTGELMIFEKYQDTLTAGDGISIVDGVISVNYPNGDEGEY